MADDKVLDGLLFQLPSHGSSRVPETKKGVPLFNGAPHEFDEWRFRTMTEFNALSAIPDVDENLRRKKEFGSLLL